MKSHGTGSGLRRSISVQRWQKKTETEQEHSGRHKRFKARASCQEPSCVGREQSWEGLGRFGEDWKDWEGVGRTGKDWEGLGRTGRTVGLQLVTGRCGKRIQAACRLRRTPSLLRRESLGTFPEKQACYSLAMEMIIRD